MKQISLTILLTAAFAMAAWSQSPAASSTLPQDGQILPLWPGGAPGAQGTEDRDIPTITVYLPRTITLGMTAVVVCPGGGFTNPAMNHQSRQNANYLNSIGKAAVVLNYRPRP